MRFTAEVSCQAPWGELMAVGDAIWDELLNIDVVHLDYVKENVFTICFRGVTDLDEMPQVWAWHLAVGVWEKLGHFLTLEVLILSPSGRTLMYLFDDEGEYDAHKIAGRPQDPWPELEPHIIDYLPLMSVGAKTKDSTKSISEIIKSFFDPEALKGIMRKEK